MKQINKDFIFEVFDNSQMKREIEKVFDEETVGYMEEEFFDLVYIIIGSEKLFVENLK